MDKLIILTPWENKPSVRTALGETRLNEWLKATSGIDDRVIDLYTKKLNASDANSLIADWQMDPNTGVITITRKDGSKYSFDLNIEKIPVNMYMTSDAVLVLETDDGQQYTADLKGLIDTYVFKDSDTISFSMKSVGSTKEVTAVIKAGSITGDLLDPDYLAQIIQNVNTAGAYAVSAGQSAAEAKRWAVGDPINFPGSETDNSKYYSEQSAKSAKLAEETAKISLPKFHIDIRNMHLIGEFGAPLHFFIDENGHLQSKILEEVTA
ncbi:MAG: hypothetical protein K2J35_02455 [Eubacterium sp.]|nr:hypothetical protein [Eubacterium sp.]